MNEANPFESWQVDVGGQIYDTNFDEMAQWIFEGALLPQDRVRRGNLRWIEAQKVPSLIKFFNAKERGESPAPILTSTTSGNPPPNNSSEQTGNFNNAPLPPPPPDAILPEGAENQYQEFSNFTKSLENVEISGSYQTPADEKSVLHNSELPQIAEFCCMHEDTTTAYYCETCGNAFCKVCPKSYGGSVKICVFCGAMCQSVGKIREDFKRNLESRIAAGEGFGFADFGRALAFPFKYKTSFLLGAAMFVFFSFGQSAAGIGGIVLIFAALICFMLANMLTFGILANTIGNFSQGKLNTDFMPNFDDFSIWDDVIHPFFLSIGAYLSSFGPFILVCIAGIYLIFSSIASQNKALQAEVEKIPGTETYDMQKTVKQSEEVKKLLEGVRQQNANRLGQQEQIMQGTPPPPPLVDQGEAGVMQAQEMIRQQQQRKQELETIAGQTPETEQERFAQLFRGVLGLAAPVVIAGFIAFLWGIFYFPAACAVAGYTRSFTATLNPSVGFDTIRRLGADYFKILAMFILLCVISTAISVFLSIIFSPFDLPQLGNLPVKITGSFLTFYFSVVFSCILGYAIYKNADRLKIYRG